MSVVDCPTLAYLLLFAVIQLDVEVIVGHFNIYIIKVCDSVLFYSMFSCVLIESQSLRLTIRVFPIHLVFCNLLVNLNYSFNCHKPPNYFHAIFNNHFESITFGGVDVISAVAGDVKQI